MKSKDNKNVGWQFRLGILLSNFEINQAESLESQ